MQNIHPDSDRVHPCFDDEARRKYARVHVPVAPFCNVQCNYCNRKFDCVNETRPGVTSKLLSPTEAVGYVDQVVIEYPNTSVVGVAGPGDPFADPDRTLETFRLVRESFPKMHLCVATNGLDLARYVRDLEALRVGHVTITINAVYPTIGAKIYRWVRKNGKLFIGEKGAEALLESQLEGLDALVAAGITVKINTVVLPGINFDHVADIAEMVGSRGASVINCISFIPVKSTIFEELTPPSAAAMKMLRKEVRRYLPTMNHCARCRADAKGMLSRSREDTNWKIRCGSM